MSIETRVAWAAGKIAGAAWDDIDGEPVDRLAILLVEPGVGSDGDLTSEDIESLALLYGVLKGVPAMLLDSETNEELREATADEVIESALTADGHISVDGRTCYVF